MAGSLNNNFIIHAADFLFFQKMFQTGDDSIFARRADILSTLSGAAPIYHQERCVDGSIIYVDESIIYGVESFIWRKCGTCYFRMTYSLPFGCHMRTCWVQTWLWTLVLMIKGSVIDYDYFVRFFRHLSVNRRTNQPVLASAAMLGLYGVYRQRTVQVVCSLKYS